MGNYVSQQFAPGALWQGARIQVRVIGALIIRELQTRFGRENIGFLWMIVEPAMLGIGITVIHYVINVPLPEGLQPIPFYISGYIPFMLFRYTAIRAGNTILSNRVLMYHRQVRPLDLLLAATLLELAASLMVLFILLYGAAWAGFAPLPQRPLLLIAGITMMWWLATATAMIVCALSQFFPGFFERLIPAFLYLSVPFSGMFFRIDWLPQRLREIFIWIPIPQIVDICRLGVWSHLEPNYIRVPYLFAFCGVMTLVGLFALSAIRSRIKFS